MKDFYNKWKEIVLIALVLIVAIVVLFYPYKAQAESLAPEFTGLWGVDGTETNGFAITNVDDNFAALQFANYRGSLQAWALIDRDGFIYQPISDTLGDPVGQGEFIEVDNNRLIYDYVILDPQARDLCDNGLPVPSPAMVCQGSLNLFRITQPVKSQTE